MFDKSNRLALYANILSAALGVFLIIFTDLFLSGIVLTISALALHYGVRQFDKSDRLELYSTILSATLGVFLIIFTSLFLSGIVLTISAVVLYYAIRHLNKTAFTVSSLERTVTIQDNSGSKAAETQKHAVIANQSGISEFWCRNINSNGYVSYITINGTSPAEQRQEDGNTHAAIKFDGNIKSGQAFDIDLSFNHKDAFKDTHCKLAHTVDNDTNLLRLVVILPEGRPVTSASVSSKVDDVETPMLPPVIANNGNIVAEIRNPLIGATYYLQWDCPKQNLVDKLDNMFNTK